MVVVGKLELHFGRLIPAGGIKGFIGMVLPGCDSQYVGTVRKLKVQ